MCGNVHVAIYAMLTATEVLVEVFYRLEFRGTFSNPVLSTTHSTNEVAKVPAE